MSDAMTITRPMGVIPGMSFESYLAVDAASSHALIDMRGSAALCRWNKDNPVQESPDMFIGTACHDCILSPETFPCRYIVGGDCEAILKSGPNKGLICGKSGKESRDGRWYCLAHSQAFADDEIDEIPANAAIITLKEHDQITSAADAVNRHPTIREMLDLSPPEDRELSVFWIDGETGVYCKARFDALARGLKIIHDLKSSRSAHKDFWMREAKSRGYDMQGAWYLEAAKAVGLDIDRFKAIPFEKKGPYCVNWAHFDPEILKLAARANRACLRKYAECLASGNWPGYDENGFIVKANQWDEIRVNELEASNVCG